MVKHCGTKINIGLQVLKKREDGYHAIKSLFYPLPFGDVLELVEAKTDDLTLLGNTSIAVPREENLVWKGWMHLKEIYKLPAVHWFLMKAVPPGTGIGAGSADLVAMLHLSNQHFSLQLSTETLEEIALKFGSDTGFFVRNQPAMVQGRGEQIETVAPFLKGQYLVLLKPKNVQMSTAQAFASITPGTSQMDFNAALNGDISAVFNDFQPGFLNKFPQCKSLIQQLKNAGAHYVSLSGSGSCWYGVFEEQPSASSLAGLPILWQGCL